MAVTVAPTMNGSMRTIENLSTTKYFNRKNSPKQRINAAN